MSLADEILQEQREQKEQILNKTIFKENNEEMKIRETNCKVTDEFLINLMKKTNGGIDLNNIDLEIVKIIKRKGKIDGNN